MKIAERLRNPNLFMTKAYVAGEWIAAETGASFPVHDPATGAVLAELPALSERETRDAIIAAEQAWPAWRARSNRAILVVVTIDALWTIKRPEWWP
jgi:succinate-semialdehyde dehydrogenase/glutarate-semialdehyde dehydrogenase